jgi:Fe-S oxidoreductase
MALSLVEERIEVDEALAEITYACTACGLCDVSCKFIMEAERHLINMALREHIVERGFGPSAHRGMIERLEAHGHPAGESAASRASWAEGLDLKVAPAERAPVLLLAGCLAAGDSDSARVARKLARLLLKAGVDFAILGEAERCCGLPAYWTGHRDLFTGIATDEAGRLDDLGAETIVTTSGSCLGAMRSKYPEYARSPRARVVHATEFLAELIEKGGLQLTRPLRRSITYHDPCYLGRQSEPPVAWEGEYKTSHGCMTYADPPREIRRGVGGVFDEPRRLLRAIPGIDLVEMARIREYAYCCGGGGGVPEAYPELARSAALDRLDEAADTGADCLVTACHHCRANLRQPQVPGEGRELAVMDIVDLVFEAAGVED